jgi:hypothetical protein
MYMVCGDALRFTILCLLYPLHYPHQMMIPLQLELRH